MTRPLTVVFFPVHNINYPRNNRIRSFLCGAGWTCIAIERGVGRETTLSEKVRAVKGLLANARRADVIVLSELSNRYAAFTWLVARLFSAVHVVDGFIGVYETDIEDKKLASARSVRAYLARLIDRVAQTSADVYLVDTDVRRSALDTALRPNSSCITLPVGAPSWARFTSTSPANHGPTRVLYYGNYIPLHGLEHFVEAWGQAANREEIVATFIGRGDRYDAVRAAVDMAQLADRVEFLPPVAEPDLAAHIADSDVVLGVFGDSLKARTVIANKVWQGLATGRTVMTRSSDALDEVRGLVAGQLVQVDVSSLASMTRAIEQMPGALSRVSDPAVTDRLESYVNCRFNALDTELRRRVGSYGITSGRS